MLRTFAVNSGKGGSVVVSTVRDRARLTVGVDLRRTNDGWRVAVGVGPLRLVVERFPFPFGRGR